MNTALIIIDIQNDYFPNGSMELVNPDKAAANAVKVLEWFRQNHKDNIFHVQHIASNPALGFFLPETEGAKIHSSIQPLENEEVIIKHFPNSFLKTTLEIKLKEKEINKVIIVGMMTHMCIDATVRAVVDLGYEATLIEDACATRDLSYKGKNVSAEFVHASFVGALDGMYAKIFSTEQFLAAKNKPLFL